MAAHDFKSSMNFEQKKAKRADAFYRQQFEVEGIKRFNNQTKEDMNWQRKDVDLLLKKQGEWHTVSEKFRKADFGDLYIEIFSKYPHTAGWMEGNEAKYLAYFFPKRMLWLKKEGLYNFYTKVIKNNLPQPMVQKFHEENRFRSGKKKLKVGFKEYNGVVTLIQAYNRSGKARWHTIGISVPFGLLRQLEVPIKFYDLP